MDQADIDHLEKVLDTVGPKRVKTVDVEVEQHSLKDILAAADRLQRKPVLFGNFPVAIAQPKDECHCEAIKSTEERSCR